MDQAIVLGARAGCASRIDFHPLRLTPTAVPTDWQFFVAWSLVHAEKSGSAQQAYNERTRQCDEARRLVAARLGRREDISYPDLLAAAPVAALLETAASTLSGVLARRFRHVVTEAEPSRQHAGERSEEHTSELQSHSELVCRLLLEKKNQRGSETTRSPKKRHTSREQRNGKRTMPTTAHAPRSCCPQRFLASPRNPLRPSTHNYSTT